MPHSAHSLDPLHLLKQAGLKATEQRKVIIGFLVEHHGPFTVEEIAAALEAEKFDLATLYRSLTSFEAAGLVEKRVFGDGPIRWELTHSGPCAHHGEHEHHHHLMCTACKHIVRLDICLPESELKKIEALGYQGLKHHLEFSGVCPACQQKR